MVSKKRQRDKRGSVTVRLPWYQWNLFDARLCNVELCEGCDKQTGEEERSFSPYYSALWVIHGRVQERMGKKPVVANEGEWLFSCPGKIHRSSQAARTSFLRITFSIKWAGGGNLLLPYRQTLWKSSAIPELQETSMHLYECIKKINTIEGTKNSDEPREGEVDMVQYLSLQHMFDKWFVIWLEDMDRQNRGWGRVSDIDSKLAYVTQYLESAPFSQPVSVEEMACSLNMSKSHLTHLFHQKYGMPPKAYRMSFKLHQAVRELQTTRDAIKQVANRFGYNSTWFGAWLKKKTGKTPSEIRGSA